MHFNFLFFSYYLYNLYKFIIYPLTVLYIYTYMHIYLYPHTQSYISAILTSPIPFPHLLPPLLILVPGPYSTFMSFWFF